jgi:hypothetical protein
MERVDGTDLLTALGRRPSEHPALLRILRERLPTVLR